MDFNIEVRKKQLDNLDQLVSTAKSRIQSVLTYLGWSKESVEKGDSLVQCPINPHHRIDPNSWNHHIEKCILQIGGYDTKTQFLSESLNDPKQSIYIDHNKKVEIITKELSEKGTLRLAWNGLDPDPRTSDRLTSTYSPDERLIFYNYCIQNTEGPAPPSEFTTLYDKKQSEEKPLSYEEILAQERDAKRRRTKYKSVHINKKNHTEVIREVINGQMEEYKEWLVSKEQSNGVGEEKKDEPDRPHSSISRNSNSSSSRSTTKKYDNYKEKRERSRERHRPRDHERTKSRNVSPYRRSNEDRYRDGYSADRKRSRERYRGSRDRRRSYEVKKR